MIIKNWFSQIFNSSLHIFLWPICSLCFKKKFFVSQNWFMIIDMQLVLTHCNLDLTWNFISVWLLALCTLLLYLLTYNLSVLNFKNKLSKRFWNDMHKHICNCNNLRTVRIVNISCFLCFLIFCNSLAAYIIRKKLS